MTNRHTNTAGLLAGMLLLLVSASVSGQTADERVGQFCGLANDRRQVIDSSLASKRSIYAAAQADRAQKTASRRTTVDEVLQQSRGAADTVRGRSLELLMLNQESDAHRAAATTYTAAVETAVAARRAAFDAARQTFRQQVDSLHASREQAVQARLDEWTVILDAADDEVRTECGRSRSDRVTIRSGYIEALKSARSAYALFRQEKRDAGETIGEYVSARNDAFEAAVTEFEQAMRAAREAFEASKALTQPGN